MRTNLEKLWARASKHARISGFGTCADDFASWYALSLLEGKREHATIGQAFIDYLRQTRGNEQNAPNARYHERVFGVAFDTFEEEIESKDKRNNALAMMIQNQEVKNALLKLSKNDMEVVELYFFDDIPMKDIARVRGVTESRISQHIKEILKKIIEQSHLK